VHSRIKMTIIQKLLHASVYMYIHVCVYDTQYVHMMHRYTIQIYDINMIHTHIYVSFQLMKASISYFTLMCSMQ